MIKKFYHKSEKQIFTASKQMLNEEKENLKMGGRFCAFLHALVSLPPHWSDNLKDTFPVGNIGPWLQRGRADFIHRLFRMFVLTCAPSKLVWGRKVTYPAQKHCRANKLSAIT